MKVKQLITILIALVIIISIFVGYYLIVVNKVSSWTTRGQIGDTFGAPNAFLSALAILGVIYTIFQQNEIIYQGRIEIDNSVNEFQESIKQFEQQQKIQALTTLISIYEKKFELYRKQNDQVLMVETNKKLTDLTIRLEKILYNT